MSSEDQEIIQYVPFISFVNPSFWHALTEMKLNIDKLNETTKQIFGRFTYRDDIGSVFEVDSTSFNKNPATDLCYITVTGTIMNKNTIEDFKNIDKASLLNSVGEMIWATIKSKEWIENPNKLINFLILSFADLKKFHYYYWFAFPAPSQPIIHTKSPSTAITAHLSNKQLDQLSSLYKTLPTAQQCFFIITKDGDNIKLKKLSDIFHINAVKQDKLDIDLNNSFFVFMDPSNGNNPGWPLRVFLTALLEHCPCLAEADIKVIGLRCKINGGFEGSLVFDVTLPRFELTNALNWVGWERNEKGNFGPRLANMAASMDPVKLADTSSDLNIKLMKWRLVPEIDIEVMKKTKCLLLGAGTLGCHVARDLLAWGFRDITFIDNGKVSFSNPTRQVLFTFQDCLNGGRKKAQAAADNLKTILPSVKSKGIVAHIPMPGHPIGESLKEETISNIKTITEAIENHDVIFLLLDTREARWLPTLIAAHYGKVWTMKLLAVSPGFYVQFKSYNGIVINAALGFDSYLVMRHGVGLSLQEGALNKEFLCGGQLGCYFCNDVTAPGNSIKDRTLDQQCTVTRPGVAAIAGALAVELLVALLQHPLRVHAPAVYNLTDSELPPELQGVLGPIPHSIRGFLHSYQSVVPTCTKFRQCIACSDVVIHKYREEGIEFLFKVFNSGNYLEEITGLSELHLTAEMSDILTLSDEEDGCD